MIELLNELKEEIDSLEAISFEEKLYKFQILKDLEDLKTEAIMSRIGLVSDSSYKINNLVNIFKENFSGSTSKITNIRDLISAFRRELDKREEQDEE